MPLHESKDSGARIFAIPSNGAPRFDEESTGIIKLAVVGIVGIIRNARADLWCNILISCLVTVARHFDDPEETIDQITERTKQSLRRLNN